MRSSPPRHSTQGRPENFFYFFHKNCPICPFEGLEGLQLSLLRNDFLSFRRRVATRAYRFRPRPPQGDPKTFFIFFTKIVRFVHSECLGVFEPNLPKSISCHFQSKGHPLKARGLIGSGFAPPLQSTLEMISTVGRFGFVRFVPLVGLRPSAPRPLNRSDRPLDFTSSASSLISRRGGQPRGAKTFFIFFTKFVRFVHSGYLGGFEPSCPKSISCHFLFESKHLGLFER